MNSQYLLCCTDIWCSLVCRNIYLTPCSLWDLRGLSSKLEPMLINTWSMQTCCCVCILVVQIPAWYALLAWNTESKLFCVSCSLFNEWSFTQMCSFLIRLSEVRELVLSCEINLYSLWKESTVIYATARTGDRLYGGKYECGILVGLPGIPGGFLTLSTEDWKHVKYRQCSWLWLTEFGTQSLELRLYFMSK